MAMTPSQLSIIVKSQGVADAAVELDKLAKAASSVDAETKAFVIAQSKLADSSKKVSQSSEAAARGITTQELAMIKLHEAANRMNAVYDRQHAAQQKLVDNAFARALKEQEVSARKAEEALAKKNKELEKHSDALKTASHHGSIFNNTLRSMTTAALAYMGINFATGLFKSADAWASMQAKLSLATGSMNAAKVVQEDLYKISQNIRIPLEDTAKLYNRMVHPLMMMGKTSKDTTDMVSSMGYALKLSGATGQEAASAMLQFSQSMNAGRLNGGEFNSIAEASPNILRAIEAELVRTGRAAELSSQGLKKMAAEGQLTAKLVSEAMLRALPQWRKDFESLPLTVDGAITRIKNMWEKSIGNLAQDTGFAQNFTKLLGQLETVIPAFAKTIVSAFSLVIDYAGLLLKALAAVAAIGLANWAYTSFMAVQGLSVGMKAATLATNALAGSMALLQSSMMWFAGAAIGIGLIVKGYQELNKERMGLGEATSSLEDSHKKYIKELESETSMLIKQVNLMREKRGESSRLIDPYEKSTAAKSEERVNELLTKKLDIQNKLAATQKEINKLQSMVGTGSESTELARIARITKLNSVVKEAKESLDRVAADELEEIGKKKMVEFATDKAQKESAIARTKEAENKLNQMTQFKQKAIDLFNETKKLADAELAAGNISQKFYNEKIEAAKKLRDIKQPTVRDITPDINNLDKANKLLADQITLNKEWEVSANKKATIGQRFSEDVEKENKALERTLESGTAHNKLLSEAEKRQIRKTLETNKEAIAVAKIVEAQQKYREMEQVDSSRIEKAEQTLEAEEQNLAILQRQLDLGEESKVARAQQSVIEAQIALDIVRQNMGMNEELVNAMKILKVREDTLAAIQGIEAKDNIATEAKKYEDAYQAANKKIQDGLYDAIGKGGESAIKKLIQDIKSWFARLVLSPIIDPISKVGASIMNPNAASAQDSFNISETFSKLAGSFTTLGTNVTKGVQAVLDKAGLSMAEGAPSSFATGAGTVASYGAGIAAGVYGGRAISNGYSVGDHGNALVNMGTAAGAIIAGPIGAAIGGAIAGGINRAFGMREKEFADQTVTGNLGTNDLTRNQAWIQSGGLFRSDKADTWKYKLTDSTATTSDGKSYQDTASVSSDKALLNQLNGAYEAIKIASTEYAKALGLNAESIKSRTDAINFTFGKTAEETSANISKAFEGITNNIAKDLLGSLTELALQNESYAATMGRLATNISTTNGMFKALGYNLFELNTNGIKAANSLVTLFGGLDKFQAIASDYYDKFYSESEKTQVKVNAMTKSLKDLGVELPSSRAAFRGLVEAAQKAGNNELYASLMKLSSAFAEITDESGNTVSRLGQLPQAMRDTFEALAKDAERWLNLSKSASSLRGSINEILTGATANSAKKAENLWKMLESDISVEQKMSLAGELKDVILSKYQVERDSITKLLDLSRQLKNFVEGLKVGSMSPLTTTQKLEEAKKQYEGLLAKAKGGDTTAQGALTGSATTYLELARTALASGTEYRTIFDEITTSLEGFSVDTQTAEEKMVELNKSQEIELMKLVSQLDIIESVADSYYKTSLVEMTKQLTVMQEMYIKLGNLDGIAVDLAQLPAEMAAVLAGKFGRTGGEEFIEGLYKKYTGKSAQEIDEQGMDYWAEELMKYGRDYTVKAFIDSVKPPAPVVNKPSDTTTILVNTVVQLKEEISALRDDQNKQTEALITATVISNQENATDVVDGVDEMYNKKNWRDVNAPALV